MPARYIGKREIPWAVSWKVSSSLRKKSPKRCRRYNRNLPKITTRINLSRGRWRIMSKIHTALKTSRHPVKNSPAEDKAPSLSLETKLVLAGVASEILAEGREGQGKNGGVFVFLAR